MAKVVLDEQLVEALLGEEAGLGEWPAEAPDQLLGGRHGELSSLSGSGSEEDKRATGVSALFKTKSDVGRGFEKKSVEADDANIDWSGSQLRMDS